MLVWHFGDSGERHRQRFLGQRAKGGVRRTRRDGLSDGGPLGHRWPSRMPFTTARTRVPKSGCENMRASRRQRRVRPLPAPTSCSCASATTTTCGAWRWAKTAFSPACAKVASSSITPRRPRSWRANSKRWQQTAAVGFLDAPVSGGQAGAENGQLTIMVGGSGATFEQAAPVMECYAKAVRLMGGAGSGQLTKMVNQVCIAGVLQGLAEGLHFAEKAGLDVDAVVDVISKGAAQSWQMDNRAATMARREFEFGFAVNWMRKDLDMTLAAARQLDARMPAGRAGGSVLRGRASDGRRPMGYLQPRRTAASGGRLGRRHAAFLSRSRRRRLSRVVSGGYRQAAATAHRPRIPAMPISRPSLVAVGRSFSPAKTCI